MLFRITIKLPSGRRMAGIGFFAGQAEAVDQTMADWPQAVNVTTRCLSWRAKT